MFNLWSVMPRTTAGTIPTTVLMLLIATSMSAQKPTVTKTPTANKTTRPNYFPLQVGNRWVFHNTENDFHDTWRVAKTSKVSDYLKPHEYRYLPPGFVKQLSSKLTQLKILQVIEHYVGKEKQPRQDRYFVSANGKTIKLHAALIHTSAHLNGIAIIPYLKTPPIFYLQYPQQGDTHNWWTTIFYSHSKQPARYNYRLDVYGVEDVKTPAGVFKNCIKTRVKLTRYVDSDKIASRDFIWLAPNVGPVQIADMWFGLYQLTSYTVKPNKKQL